MMTDKEIPVENKGEIEWQILENKRKKEHLHQICLLLEYKKRTMYSLFFSSLFLCIIIMEATVWFIDHDYMTITYVSIRYPFIKDIVYVGTIGFCILTAIFFKQSRDIHRLLEKIKQAIVRDNETIKTVYMSLGEVS